MPNAWKTLLVGHGEHHSLHQLLDLNRREDTGGTLTLSPYYGTSQVMASSISPKKQKCASSPFEEDHFEQALGGATKSLLDMMTDRHRSSVIICPTKSLRHGSNTAACCPIIPRAPLRHAAVLEPWRRPSSYTHFSWVQPYLLLQPPMSE